MDEEETDSRGIPSSHVDPISGTPFGSATSAGKVEGADNETDVHAHPSGVDGGAEVMMPAANPTQAQSQEDDLLEIKGSSGSETQGGDGLLAAAITYPLYQFRIVALSQRRFQWGDKGLNI